MKSASPLGRLLMNERLWTVVGGLLMALLAINVIPLPDFLDPVLVLVLVATGAIAFWLTLKKSSQTPVWSYLALQLMFVWLYLEQNVFAALGLPLKPYIMAFGLVMLSTGYQLVSHFWYFWQYPLFRGIFLFFCLNAAYFLVYHSDFNLSAIQAGYQLPFKQDVSDMPAYRIVFLCYLGSIIACACPLAIFRPFLALPLQERTQAVRENLTLIFKVIIGGMLLFTVAQLLGQLKLVDPTRSYFYPSMIFFMAGMRYWVKTENPGARFFQFSFLRVINLTLGFNLLLSVLMVNKTSLIAYGLCILLYLFLLRRCGLDSELLEAIGKIRLSVETKLAMTLIALVGGFVVWHLGVGEVVMSKLEYFTEGFSRQSTLTIRTTNWYYFNQDWLDTLDPIKALLGYGAAASRKTIFYVSAMREGGYTTLVQTLHNGYMELFYDFGLLALLFFVPLFQVVRNNVQTALSWQSHPIAKKFSLVSLCVLLILLINLVTDGPKVVWMIQFFGMVALCEGIKWLYAPLPAKLKTT